VRQEGGKESKKVWFGDYLFRNEYSDVLADFQDIGVRLGFSVVSSTGSPEAICIVNFYLRDVITLVRSPALRRLNLRMHLITEPSVTLPILNLKFWTLLRLVRVELGSDGQNVVEKPHRCEPGPDNFDRLDRAVIVNANKFSWVKGEQYTLRRQVVSECRSVDTYGSGWNGTVTVTLLKNAAEMLRAAVLPSRFHFGARHAFSKPHRYLGSTPDKIATLSNYKVCLVIENSRELLTEKLIDAWMAGCIPVYVGPDLSSRGIPDSAYIRAEPTLASIEAAIERAFYVDWDSYQSELNAWLSTPEFTRKWGLESAWSIALHPILQSNS